MHVDSVQIFTQKGPSTIFLSKKTVLPQIHPPCNRSPFDLHVPDLANLGKQTVVRSFFAGALDLGEVLHTQRELSSRLLPIIVPELYSTLEDSANQSRKISHHWMV